MNNDLKKYAMQYYDFFDRRGSIMTIMFDFCEFLYLGGWEVPSELDYIPSPFMSEPENLEIFEYLEENFSIADIQEFLKICNRYVDRLDYLESGL